MAKQSFRSNLTNLVFINVAECFVDVVWICMCNIYLYGHSHYEVEGVRYFFSNMKM